MRPSSDTDKARSVPRHVAVIMDGNGRWATARGLPRVMGHRQGANVVRPIVEAAADAGVDYLTLFAFSAENWTRPQSEIDELMRLLRIYLRSQIAELHRNGVRMRVIGDRSRLSKDINTLIDRAEDLTRDNTRITLSMALNYGSRQEIVQAVQAIAADAKSGAIDPAAIDDATINAALYTADMPDPDLLIRTSGEKRISNFLLWQFAYTELVFIDTLWPDFSRAEFEHALAEYQRRDRRFGATASAQ
jgi:undecaprenyl diphosphate synthase